MRVFVGQIYIQPEANYPFSHNFQKWISEELSKIVEPSDSFLKKYTDDFDLIFRISAKKEIDEIEVKGPTVFKKDKDIEFTIFLPYDHNSLETMDDFKQPLLLFLDGVAIALEQLTIDATKVKSNASKMVESIISNKSMFKPDKLE